MDLRNKKKVLEALRIRQVWPVDSEDLIESILGFQAYATALQDI